MSAAAADLRSELWLTPKFQKTEEIAVHFNTDDYGLRIRSLRKNRGLTQEQLAEKMNVSTPT
ncbi:helix-turn-helix domain-containing protein [Butyricicoccus pullicaecorum]|uniref:HTH cro/C1-type domain-containing protein n=1 Tax=Butyricicoccus pullicaecorum TaxID=501571 RepID=A0A1Y4LTV1_9FIRM|nr:hypothetical protein B5F15_07465 [Butyricicoccus pullicaecorum]